MRCLSAWASGEGRRTWRRGACACPVPREESHARPRVRFDRAAVWLNRVHSAQPAVNLVLYNPSLRCPAETRGSIKKKPLRSVWIAQDPRSAEGSAHLIDSPCHSAAPRSYRCSNTWRQLKTSCTAPRACAGLHPAANERGAVQQLEPPGVPASVSTVPETASPKLHAAQVLSMLDDAHGRLHLMAAPAVASPQPWRPGVQHLQPSARHAQQRSVQRYTAQRMPRHTNKAGRHMLLEESQRSSPRGGDVSEPRKLHCRDWGWASCSAGDLHRAGHQAVSAPSASSMNAW